ncbi:uncharacterized protein LOC143018312 [Oratosquilla oratoria]|uniref:uncharacterized protein LOC143018312 n=1 Tax=Oratosquilla oratoria TaxID=337810 RepID=UPI003F76E49F
MDTLLMDVTKFERITKNPIEEIKTKVNRIVDTVNAKAGGLKLPKLVGNYGLGYCYGNVKTHKAGSPLRPIISQIPTPTYVIAKKLNELLTPFVPSRFSLSSAADFLDLLSNSDTNGVIASLDAESLFTHVPILRTINYILEEVYPENGVPKLDLPKAALKALLEVCTMEAPFVCPRGNMYRQIDGVAMGSPLGVLFANFFMGMVEKETLNCFKKPSIYARYIDDIFVKVDCKSELPLLKDILQEISGLNFTIEFSQENKLPFLDILVQQSPLYFKTSVYTKPTNPGLCLNGMSECPQRYKDSTIRAFIRRALTHSSSWSATYLEIERATQVLVNNGYPNKEINKIIKHEIDKWYLQHNATNKEGERIKIFYKTFMH